MGSPTVVVDNLTMFHGNHLTTFCVILLVDRQTNERTCEAHTLPPEEEKNLIVSRVTTDRQHWLHVLVS